MSSSDPAVVEVRFCGFTLNVPRRSLRHHAEPVALTPKELDLLILLVQSHGRAVTRDEIFYQLWPSDEINDSALSQTVYRLRRRLEKYDPYREYVRTVQGIGFQFVPPVEKNGARTTSARFSTEAFQNYRRGMFRLEQGTQAALEESISLFERALEADREFVPVLVGMAHAHTLAALMRYTEPHTAYSRAKRLAADALQLDPLAGEALAIMSHILLFFDRNIAAASSAADSAISIAPFSKEALTAAVWASVARGEGGEGLAHLRSALSVDPCSPVLTTLLGICLYYAGRYADAHRQFIDALIFDPRHALAQYFDACALSMLQAYDAAEDRLSQIIATDANNRTLALRAYVAGRRGDVGAFERVFAQLYQASSPSNVLNALALAGAGCLEDAHKHLQLALHANEPNLVILSVEPLVAELRARPATARLVEEIRTPAHERCRRCRTRIPIEADRFLCRYECIFCASCERELMGECSNCVGTLNRVPARQSA